MLTEQRKLHLLSLLERDGRIVAKQAAVDLELSEDTIRRDLRELAAEGRLQRVHGGALPASAATGSLKVRRTIVPSEKAEIGRHAASMILPGQTVFIDGGTTAMQIVRHLDREIGATIVTHSPLVAGALADHAAQVLLIGGQLFKHSMVSVGVAALQAVREVRPDIFFMGVTGVHPSVGLTTGDAEEAAMKRAIAEASAELVVMASSEKIGAASPFVIVPVERADIIIVPPRTRPDTLTQFKGLCVDLRLATV